MRHLVLYENRHVSSMATMLLSIGRVCNNAPSKPKIHANPSSTALHAMRPPTSHQVSRCLLTGARSPSVISEAKVKSNELKIRLLRTTRTNLTGEGIFDTRETW